MSKDLSFKEVLSAVHTAMGADLAAQVSLEKHLPIGMHVLVCVSCDFVATVEEYVYPIADSIVVRVTPAAIERLDRVWKEHTERTGGVFRVPISNLQTVQLSKRN